MKTHHAFALRLCAISLFLAGVMSSSAQAFSLNPIKDAKDKLKSLNPSEQLKLNPLKMNPLDPLGLDPVGTKLNDGFIKSQAAMLDVTAKSTQASTKPIQSIREITGPTQETGGDAKKPGVKFGGKTVLIGQDGSVLLRGSVVHVEPLGDFYSMEVSSWLGDWTVSFGADTVISGLEGRNPTEYFRKGDLVDVAANFVHENERSVKGLVITNRTPPAALRPVTLKDVRVAEVIVSQSGVTKERVYHIALEGGVATVVAPEKVISVSRNSVGESLDEVLTRGSLISLTGTIYGRTINAASVHVVKEAEVAPVTFSGEVQDAGVAASGTVRFVVEGADAKTYYVRARTADVRYLNGATALQQGLQVSIAGVAVGKKVSASAVTVSRKSTAVKDLEAVVEGIDLVGGSFIFKAGNVKVTAPKGVVSVRKPFVSAGPEIALKPGATVLITGSQFRDTIEASKIVVILEANADVVKDFKATARSSARPAASGMVTFVAKSETGVWFDIAVSRNTITANGNVFSAIAPGTDFTIVKGVRTKLTSGDVRIAAESITVQNVVPEPIDIDIEPVPLKYKRYQNLQKVEEKGFKKPGYENER